MRITSKLAVAVGLCALMSTALADKVLYGSGLSTSNGVGVVTALTNKLNVTVEAWVCPDRNYGKNINPLFSVFSGITTGAGDADFVFGVNNGKLSCFHRKGNMRYQDSATTVPNKKWSHVALTRTATTLKYYLNGVCCYTTNAVVASTGAASTYPAFGNFVPTIGGQKCDSEETWSNYTWGGGISDLRVWTVTRTDEEIAANYRKRLSGSEEGLAVYVPFHDANGQVCPDRASATTVLAITPWQIKEDSSLSLPDAAPTQIVPARAFNVAFTTDAGHWVSTDARLSGKAFTFETWVNTGKMTTKENPFMSQRAGSNIKVPGALTLGIHKSTMRPYVYLHNGNGESSGWGQYISSTDIPTGTWTHVAYARNGADLKIYVNGELNYETNGCHDVAVNSATNLVLFNSMTGVAGQDCSYGMFREVRAWNVMRTQEEIKAGMRRQASGREEGLVGCWPLAEKTGTTIRNLVNGHDSDMATGVMSWINRNGPALAPAEGVTPPPTELSPSFGGGWCGKGRTGVKTQLNDFTLEAWVKVRDANRDYFDGKTDNAEPILSQENADDNARGRMFFCLRFGRSTQPCLFMRSTTTGEANKPNEGWVSATGVSVPVDVWTHLAVTRKGTTLDFYMDGEHVFTKTGFTDCPTCAEEFLIGKLIPGAKHKFNMSYSHSFDGKIREVRVWDYARTGQSIAKYRDKKLTGKDYGLVAYWPLDAQDGLNLKNAKAGGADGTLYAGWTYDEPVPLTGAAETITPGVTIIFK